MGLLGLRGALARVRGAELPGTRPGLAGVRLTPPDEAEPHDVEREAHLHAELPDELRPLPTVLGADPGRAISEWGGPHEAPDEVCAEDVGALRGVALGLCALPERCEEPGQPRGEGEVGAVHPLGVLGGGLLEELARRIRAPSPQLAEHLPEEFGLVAPLALFRGCGRQRVLDYPLGHEKLRLALRVWARVRGRHQGARFRGRWQLQGRQLQGRERHDRKCSGGRHSGGCSGGSDLLSG
mmetsp:Transcript_92952/g.201016  ORF Transcript_92952/g.201016 Transcript_92952/m.201016 type:complete len:239 (+) Transcript_92952:1474-2190(+)